MRKRKSKSAGRAAKEMRDKLRKIICLSLAAVCIVCLPVKARAASDEEIYEKSGAQGMYDSLDEETKQLLSQVGTDSAKVSGEINAQDLFHAFSALFRETFAAPLKTMAALLAMILLCRLANCFENKEIGAVSGLAGTLGCAAVMAVPLTGLISSARMVVESASVFLLAGIPVYSALLIASGNTAAGGSYSFLALAAANAIPALATSLLFPMLQLLLAFGLAASVSSAKLERISNSLYGFGKWLLILIVTLFSGFISVQTVLNSQVDAAANKTAKLLASSAIPIVGGAFGDAVAAIQSSVRILKSGVGAFGILASLCIFAPSVIESVLWITVCNLGQIAGDLFELPKISGFLGICASVARMVLAVLSSVCAVSIVCAALTLFLEGSM